MTSANFVKELREKTGAGFMECKKALEESQNDMDKAVEYLRKRGLAAASKKAGRTANEGRVHSYIHGNGKVGVMIEVNCETDFVARNEQFIAFVNDLAMHVAAASPRFLDKDQVPTAEIEKEKEIFKAQAEASGKKGPVIEKIVEGKIAKFYDEICLLHQGFVKEPEKKIEELVKEMIAKLGENITVRRFVRFQLGEGAPKPTSAETTN